MFKSIPLIAIMCILTNINAHALEVSASANSAQSASTYTYEKMNTKLLAKLQKELDSFSNSVAAFYLPSCPEGWRLADGTNNTPDLRGEFIRGLDAGRGIDPGRSLASSQSDMFKSHSHGQSLSTAYYTNSLNFKGAYAVVPSNSGSAVGGSETRPRNIALLYCVKN